MARHVRMSIYVVAVCAVLLPIGATSLFGQAEEDGQQGDPVVSIDISSGSLGEVIKSLSDQGVPVSAQGIGEVKDITIHLEKVPAKVAIRAIGWVVEWSVEGQVLENWYNEGDGVWYLRLKPIEVWKLGEMRNEKAKEREHQLNLLKQKGELEDGPFREGDG